MMRNIHSRSAHGILLTRACALTLMLLLTMGGNATTATAAPPNAPVITSVTINYATNQLTITGADFGDRAPVVRLRGSVLTLVSNTATLLVATLPPGIEPGTHLLSVSPTQPNGREDENKAKTAVFNVAFGAVGPQGPAGATGPQDQTGPQGTDGNQNTFPSTQTYTFPGNGTVTITDSHVTANSVIVVQYVGGSIVPAVANNISAGKFTAIGLPNKKFRYVVFN